MNDQQLKEAIPQTEYAVYEKLTRHLEEQKSNNTMSATTVSLGSVIDIVKELANKKPDLLQRVRADDPEAIKLLGEVIAEYAAKEAKGKGG